MLQKWNITRITPRSRLDQIFTPMKIPFDNWRITSTTTLRDARKHPCNLQKCECNRPRLTLRQLTSQRVQQKIYKLLTKFGSRTLCISCTSLIMISSSPKLAGSMIKSSGLPKSYFNRPFQMLPDWNHPF